VFEKSKFGEQLTARSGIEALMEDLGHALAESAAPMRMLGGGNPAFIPEVQALWRERMRELLDDGTAFDRMLCTYDPPKGNSRFALALAGLLQREFGWDVGAEHIAITNGGQTAFFYLFNLLAGEMPNGRRKKVLLPLMPEYIGYANQGLGADFFEARAPRIQFPGPHRFKYGIDFDGLEVGSDIAAICVSRPCNPSGNVLPDAEVMHLAGLAREAGVPLIIDNAYGSPFPGVLFRDIQPIWNEDIVLVLSLSKLGLPGTRTGIVVARPEVARALSAINAVVGLANGTIGQTLALPLIESGEILNVARDVIRPFYERKTRQAREWIVESFNNSIDYHIHESEGAFFAWLWFRELPISASELYERLKRRRVLVVPGHHFCFGMNQRWRHGDECIRLNVAMDDGVVREGIEIIAEEVARAYEHGR
jgi:valine--pyruvate aminotransferase